jgi:cobalamin biosynthesis Mg chelatase CobN
MSPHASLDDERPVDPAVPDTAAVTEPYDDYVPTWEELGSEEVEEDSAEVWGPLPGPGPQR